MITLHGLQYFTLLAFAVNSTLSCAARQSTESIVGIYEGSTPCGEMPRTFLKIPVKDSCEFIKWQFTFYKAEGDKPSRFLMKAVYGLTQPNTQGFSNSAEQNFTGEWSTRRGIPGNPQALVYRLATTDNGIISFIELNKEMLHP